MNASKSSQKRVYISMDFSECPLRTLDAAKLRNYFNSNNYYVADSFDKIDFHIYVTCSAIKPIILQQLKSIKKLQDFNGELIVVGCLPGTNKEDLKAIFSGKTVVTKNLNEIDNFFKNRRCFFRIQGIC